MKILITGKGEFTTFGEEPEIGKSYFLEDSTAGSSAQGRAFHALLQEYWKSGAFSYPAKSFYELKQYIKKALGAGFESCIYVTLENGVPALHDVKTEEEIPKGIPHTLKRGRLKSFSDYTLKERRHLIDALVAEMELVGVNTPKYRLILEGMKDIWQ